jgi:hypothetical protein
MNAEQQATFFLTSLGKQRAIEHCEFVLGYDFGLWKTDLRLWWLEVLKILKEEK